MVLDLSSIINIDGKKQHFELEFDFSGCKETNLVFLSPVLVSGMLSNIGGTIELSAAARVRLKFECDRCCEPYEEDFEFSFEEVLKKENEKLEESHSDSDAIYFKGNSLELDEIVLNNILLALPLKRLCKEDCQGLCPSCGRNLNLGECGCDRTPVDPRFDVLDKFFE